MRKKNFVIIGGSHGIGLGLVQRLADRGQSITVVSRTADRLAGLRDVVHLPADVAADGLDANQLPDEIDGMAYCPGSINLGPVRSLKADSMIEDFRLNAVGAVTCLQAALPAMKAAKSSAMVMFSTVAVAQGLPMHSSVAAAKGAVEALTRSWAAELAPKIRVNCVAPALTATRLAERFVSTDQKRAAMAQKYPLKRIGEVEDVAAMADFLLSDESGWITGQVIGVDGGMSAVGV